MIRYTLKCPEAHDFESWFQSADAYESLRAGGRVTCPTCGATEIEKTLMAPSVRPARKTEAAPRHSLTQPETEREQAMARLKAEIEAKSDYVGMNFVAEARKIHAGDAPERSIYGEAKPEEAKKLLEDGIPVAPLPFMPKRRTN